MGTLLAFATAVVFYVAEVVEKGVYFVDVQTCTLNAA